MFAKPNMRVCVSLIRCACFLGEAEGRLQQLSGSLGFRAVNWESCSSYTHTPSLWCHLQISLAFTRLGGQGACLSAPVLYCLDCLDCLDGCPTLPLAGTHSAVSDPSWFPSGFNPKPQPSSKPGFGGINKGLILPHY